MPAAVALPDLYSCGLRIAGGERELGLMRESSTLTSNTEALRARIREDGYLLLRGALDRNLVMSARRRVLEQLSSEGQLDPTSDIMDGVQKQGAKLFFQPELAQKNNVQLQELLYNPEGNLMRFMEQFLDGEVLHYDFTWLRCLSPGPGTPSHCDIVFMGRGTRNLFTAWVPLGDISFTMGGLMVLENSHTNQRLQQTYGARDVDSYCINKEDDPARTANGYNGWLSEDPNHIRQSLGGRWLVAEYEAGDVVVFCMDLVHGGLDNRSDRLRLSSDSRYQLASEPADERWIGENPPGHSSAGKRGRIC